MTDQIQGLTAVLSDRYRVERKIGAGGAVALGVSLADRVGAYGEYFLFAPPGPGDDATGFLNGGLTFLATNDFQFDLRAGFGVDGVDKDFFAGAGFATRF